MIILEWFYNFSIWLLKHFLAFFGLFNKKAKAWLLGQKSINNNYSIPINSQNLIWFHCASLGEFEQGRPLIEKIKSEFPSKKILLSFFSPSGYEIRKNYKHADYITYLPVDLPNEVDKFLDFYKPEIAIFVKYEFWRNFIFACKKKNIPIYSISTIFRSKQLFFKKSLSNLILDERRNFSNEVLFQIEHFFVQDVNSADLLNSIQINQYSVVGDTRFDRVKTVVNSSQKIELVDQFKGASKCFVLGSVWQEDLAILIPYMQKNGSSNFKFIIAPHEIHEKEIQNLKEKLGEKSVLWSENPNKEKLESAYFLIVDHIGSLSSLYQYADFCFIGGAYKTGLHNILEPASFGMPIFFGDKKYHKFKEAMDLIDLEIAFPINNLENLQNQVSVFLNDNNLLKKTKENCKKYVETKTGATDKIFDYLKEKLKWQK